MTTKLKIDDLFIEGHVSDEILALLSDAQLNHRNPETISGVTPEVLDHVDQCRECKVKLMDVVSFLEAPHKIKIPAKPEPQRHQPQIFQEALTQRNRYFFTGKIAAVFLVCALFVGGYYFLMENPSALTDTHKGPSVTTEQTHQPVTLKGTNPNSHQAEGKKSQASDTTRTPSTTIPSRFTVNPSLENMIGSRMRSASFEALTPPNNSVVKGDIVFSWKQALITPHSLKIVDNHNNVLFNFSVAGKELKLEARLKEGLYYWKLENENELLYVGKFYVRGTK